MVQPMTLEQLQALRAKLIAAIASGTLELRNGDKLIQYQSTHAMIQALGTLDKEIAVASGATVTRSTFVSHSRG
jgi:hypothetical protein